MGALLLTVLSMPFFRRWTTAASGCLWLFAGAGVAASLVNGPMCATAADLFPTRIRFSGVAISFNLAFSMFSGIAPLVANALVDTTGSPVGPGYYMCGCALLTSSAASSCTATTGASCGTAGAALAGGRPPGANVIFSGPVKILWPRGGCSRTGRHSGRP